MEEGSGRIRDVGTADWVYWVRAENSALGYRRV